jgi:hypothetical protein
MVKMKFISKSFVTFVITWFICFNANAQTEWVGEYSFGENGGETAGGSKIYIINTLKITQEGDKLNAHLYSQGFQTSKDIYADVKIESNKLMLYFRETGEDNVLGDYKKGGLLLTLERKEIDGKTKILTYLGEFKPSLEANEKSGEIYFEKATEETNSNVDSHENTEWIRIESENKNFSVAFPPNYLVDANKDKKSKRVLSIKAFQNGAEIEFSIYEDKDASRRLKQFVRMNDRNYESFKTDNYEGIRSYLINSNTKIDETVQFAVDDKFYSLRVKGNMEQKDLAKRFLYSVKLFNKPFFIVEKEKDFPERIVSLKEFETSPEITEAYKRKSRKTEQNVSYELVSNTNLIDEVETGGLTRPVVIIDQPFPRVNFGSLMNRLPQSGVFEIKMIVQFLANGQIGNITVYSPKESAVTKACLESAKKIKFVPAQIDGKNVEAEKVVTYMLQIFSSPGIR